MTNPTAPKHHGANKGRNSPRWAILEKFVIPDITTGRDYLRRWRLIVTPWFGISIHHIMLPDGDTNPHNHPYWFVAIPLKGGYYEQYYEYSDNKGNPHKHPFVGSERRSLRNWNLMPLNRFHRIVTLANHKPAWTLMIHGPRKPEWGFMTPRGYVESSVYFAGN